MGFLPDKIENFQETVFDFAIGIQFRGGGLNANGFWRDPDKAPGMLATGKVRSACPVLIALFGIPSNAASEGSWTMTNPPPFFTAFEPLASIGSSAREHNANGALTAVLRQGPKKKIECQSCSVTLHWLGKM